MSPLFHTSGRATLVGALFLVHLSSLVSAQESAVVPLFDTTTKLEPPTTVDTAEALITRIGDRVRDRHARESKFKAYDHYLSFYWEQRSIHLEFVDKIARGGNEILVNIRSLTPLNEPNFRSFYRGLNTVAEYHENLIAAEVAPNHYSVKLAHHATERRPLEVGDQIEFEFSPFLASPKNGRSNYYGTTMLYVVGKGIVPWMGVGERQESIPLPESALLGGGTTISRQYSGEPAERFKQMAGNISPQSAQPFLLGRRLHHTNMLDGTHSEQPNPVFREQAGKLGPHYVARSCIACHVNNGRSLPPAPGEPMNNTVVKVASDETGTPHPRLGTALQPRSTSGVAEGSAHIQRYELIVGKYADGEEYELRKPVYEFVGTVPRFFSVRLTPQLVGLGLLEAIREHDVFALADPEDEDGDGISGRANIVVDSENNKRRLGRFGHKAGQPRLRQQIAGALNSDMGVTTTIASTLDGSSDSRPIEVSDEDLAHLERYVAVLGVSAKRNPDDDKVARGNALFMEAKCSACHTPSFTTSLYHPFAELRGQKIQPYTDLLLHDLGQELADTLGEHTASGAEWRTAPLWGIGLTNDVSGGEAYLHDGRARTLEEAILWHGGEAENAKEAFRKMPQQDRTTLIRFLQSL
ncbi:MAG: di-heme oxidoredictase family protein [Planctomycetaceae bacterium]